MESVHEKTGDYVRNYLEKRWVLRRK